MDSGRRRSLLSACAALALGVTAAAGCGSETPPPPTAPPSTAPIVIGATAALTGGLSDFGPGVRDGLRVAEQYINAVGGILGRPVNFVVLDDATDNAKTTEALDALFAQKMSVFIGPTGSNQALAVAERLLAAQIPEITASASTPSIKQPARDRFFFRTAASHARQAKALGVLALRGSAQSKAGTQLQLVPACKRVIIVRTSDEYGTTMADPLATYLTQNGATVVKTVDLGVQPAASYPAQVASVIASGADADCQILITFPAVGAQYVHDFKEATLKDSKRDWLTFSTIAANGVYNNYKPAFITNSKLATGLAAEGVVGTFPDTNPETREFDEFRALYTAQFGGPDVLVYAANAFDAAILAALAIQQAKTATDGPAIRDALFDVSKGGERYTPGQLSEALTAIKAGRDVDYKGASGDVSFDDFGEILSDYIVWKVEGGKFVTKGRILAEETRP